ncbi:hypothetical protein [Kitasatospora sp. NBC_01539]|uniref:WXG100-like domain-containing protein n=1 Tax=Kitasatospora sp. NBC_01539 TaxID=2903577 RepID=UPI00386021E7
MIELPADLAEVLKTLQSNESGGDILFPDGDEDLLAELAASWQAWNEVAETHVKAIVEAANLALASMSGPAADSFQQYLQKFAGGDGSHVTTTLLSGRAVAESLGGAANSVTNTKTEMVRELQYAKDYMEQNPAGKHDDIAESEGVKQAVTLYHQYIGQVGNNIDTMLRKSAGNITDMAGMGQTCALNGTSANGGSGVGGVPGAMSGTAGAVPGGLLGPVGANGGALGGVPGGALGGVPGGALGGSADPSAFSLPGVDGSGVGLAGGADGAGGTGSFGGIGPVGAPGASGGSGSFGGAGSFGGFGPVGGVDGFSGSGGSAGGSGGGSGLAPFTPFTPSMPDFGSGSGSGSGGGSGAVFTPLSTGSGSSLSLAGLGDLGTGVSGGGYTPSTNIGSGLGVGLGSGGGPGGSSTGSLGSALGSLGIAGGSAAHGSLAPFGGTGSSPFGLGTASGRGVGGVGGGAGGTAGRSGATGTAGMGAGGHMPGMGGAGRGGGGKEGKNGHRFVRPTRFGGEGEDEEELYGDAGILGQATDVDPRDRHWHRARRRWLDNAHADGTFAGPEPVAAQAAPAGPASENEVISQLAGVLLGGGAAADTGTGTGTASADTTTTAGSTIRQDTSTATTETPAGTDDAYLERSRSAAARRGHGDVPEAAPDAAASAAGGEAAAPQRAPLREEGGFQVPSPFLRAALSRLAAPAAD